MTTVRKSKSNKYDTNKSMRRSNKFDLATIAKYVEAGHDEIEKDEELSNTLNRALRKR
jgi:thiamine pyrophosphate-dependent acetolactate synthase large subunit-like protein